MTATQPAAEWPLHYWLPTAPAKDTGVTIFDAPGQEVWATTPNGTLYFDNRADADFELPLIFPGADITIVRQLRPSASAS